MTRRRYGTPDGPPAWEAGDEILDVTAAAAFLHCSRSGLYQRKSRNRIPYRKVEGRLLFSKRELVRYLQTRPGVDAEDLY
jgi:hypothetical protein